MGNMCVVRVSGLRKDQRVGSAYKSVCLMTVIMWGLSTKQNDDLLTHQRGCPVIATSTSSLLICIGDCNGIRLTPKCKVVITKL